MLMTMLMILIDIDMWILSNIIKQFWLAEMDWMLSLDIDCDIDIAKYLLFWYIDIDIAIDMWI